MTTRQGAIDTERGLMVVTVRCFATLARYQSEGEMEIVVRPGDTVRDLIERLGIPIAKVSAAVVNKRMAPFTQLLRERDRIGLFPASGG